MWVGIDVGGRRTGFDVAVIEGDRLVAHTRIASGAEVGSWLERFDPRVVAVDSPRRPAPDGEAARPAEREFLRAKICGIRLTPGAAVVNDEQNAYYEWIRNGFDLYTALEHRWWTVIECFPTASWTQWGGRRLAETRARWSRRVLHDFQLSGLPLTMNQDLRDAIGAALTARDHDRRQTISFDDIVVPRRLGELSPSGASRGERAVTPATDRSGRAEPARGIAGCWKPLDAETAAWVAVNARPALSACLCGWWTNKGTIRPGPRRHTQAEAHSDCRAGRASDEGGGPKGAAGPRLVRAGLSRCRARRAVGSRPRRSERARTPPLRTRRRARAPATRAPTPRRATHRARPRAQPRSRA